MCWCNSLSFDEDDSWGWQQAGNRHLHWRWQCQASRRLRLDVKRKDCARQILRRQLWTIGLAFEPGKLFSLGQLFLIEVDCALGVLDKCSCYSAAHSMAGRAFCSIHTQPSQRRLGHPGRLVQNLGATSALGNVAKSRVRESFDSIEIQAVPIGASIGTLGARSAHSVQTPVSLSMMASDRVMQPVAVH